MRNFLDTIRKPEYDLTFKKKIINTLLILLLGVVLGIISKWLDNLSIDSSILWMKIIEIFNLNNFFSDFAIWLFIAVCISIYSKSPLRASINVFTFFIGMCVSYHLYTIVFSGFNPKDYMMIWYGITIVSPLLAYICWYSKSDNKLSIIIISLIIFIMLENCFNIGMWYFDFKGILYSIVFLLICIIIYRKPFNMIISLIIGFALSLIIRIPFIIN